MAGNGTRTRAVRVQEEDQGLSIQVGRERLGLRNDEEVDALRQQLAGFLSAPGETAKDRMLAFLAAHEEGATAAELQTIGDCSRSRVYEVVHEADCWQDTDGAYHLPKRRGRKSRS